MNTVSGHERKSDINLVIQIIAQEHFDHRIWGNDEEEGEGLSFRRPFQKITAHSAPAASSGVSQAE